MASRSLSKACPPLSYQLQTVPVHPFLALQPQTVALTPVPKPPPGKTFLTWNNVAHLQPPLALLAHSLGLSLAVRMHRYHCFESQQDDQATRCLLIINSCTPNIVFILSVSFSPFLYLLIHFVKWCLLLMCTQLAQVRTLISFCETCM